MAYLQRFYDPTGKELKSFCARNTLDGASVATQVQDILSAIKKEGEKALQRYSKEFDGVTLPSLKVSAQEFAEARTLVSDDLKDAINIAAANIHTFHSEQLSQGESIEVMEGVSLWRKIVPIKRVGLYIPGGSAPLFSTVLMLAIPAQIARCESIVICTPPNKEGKIHPAILYAAEVCNVKTIFKVGGAHAIGAMAYGTRSIKKVDKIFGPGNRFVTEAKTQVGSSACAIDLPAGPSEVMVVATNATSPRFVASDLLSQAEHGPDSQAMVVLISNDPDGWIDSLEAQLSAQVKDLSRSEYVEHSLAGSKIAVVWDHHDAINVVNAYAPEHLIINTADERGDEIIMFFTENAGSIFLGPYSPESVGDYASGTNHTLPTGGWARSVSGVSVDSFIKKITVQKLSEEGLNILGPTVHTMAVAEELEAHANAVAVRLEKKR
ncbi:MAG: histidinol dehydrogenase [Sphaerochaeta sp.]